MLSKYLLRPAKAQELFATASVEVGEKNSRVQYKLHKQHHLHTATRTYVV